MKANFALLSFLVLSLSIAVLAQTPEKVSITVAVVDQTLTLKPVPKFALIVKRNGDASATRVATSADGKVELSLPPGRYSLMSEKPLTFEGRTYSWSTSFYVDPLEPSTLELSSDNAQTAENSSTRRSRDVSRGGELFKDLRDGVVTVQGELGSGTGFVIDDSGLVLTNQHVIDQSNEIRVRFDRNTAVRARLLAVDEDRDLAVLQVNLSAFPAARALTFPTLGSSELPVVEGEHVFTIGSPLNQEKILSSGTASKVEERAIITDINFNTGSSGAPLFNSIGEVVGISTFKVRDRSGSAFAGNVAAEESSGISGVVAIAEAADIISKAKAIAATKGKPSPDLMPNMPEGVFPVETIKAALNDKNFPLKQYVSDVKDYQIKYLTPVYKFYVMEKDRIESLKNRQRRNKDKGVTETADPFRDLRSWNEYAGELQPVVQIVALPETGASGKSLALNALAKSTVGFGTPLDEKYKADFYQMKLMCDGREIVPIVRNKTEIVREMKNYYKERKRYTYAGVYSYPFDVFAPGRCQQMQVQVFSEEDIENPIRSDVSETTRSRVWSDFQDFRTQIATNRH